MATLAAKAAGERLAGQRPSRVRAFLAATVAGFGTGVLVYRLLRSGEEPSEDQ
jgi:hypothetical protein